MKVRYIGIDIGTSTTVVKLRDYDDSGEIPYPTQSLRIDGSAVIPSVAFMVDDDFCEADSFRFGSDAESCQLEGKLYANFKMDLISDDEEKQQKAKDIVARFFKWLRSHYEEQKANYFGSCDQEITIISYPVRWTEELREFMLFAAQEAGFKVVRGKDEAEAAIQYLLLSQIGILRQYGIQKDKGVLKVMLIDMGAGTTDIVFGKFDAEKKELSVLTRYPETADDTNYGGNNFDEKIFRIIDSYLKSNGISGQAAIYRQQILVACKEWKEKQFSKNLNACQTIRQVPAFVKLLLQNNPGHTPFPIIDRNVFEASFSEEIDAFASIIEHACNRAIFSGVLVSKSEIDLVVLTGGHSQWYFIPELLTGRRCSPDGRDVSIPVLKTTPSKLLQLSNPSETVALGLVYDAEESIEDHGDSPLDMKIEYSDGEQDYAIKASINLEGDNNMAENNSNFRDIPILNLLVAGKTGVGKTTLVNTMFGVTVGKVDVGHPVTTKIERHEVPNYPFVVYDVQGFELSNTEDIITSIRDKVTDTQAIRDEKYMIHAILYCIEHVGARIEDKEEIFIRQLASEYKVPMFLIFTKAFMVDRTNPTSDPFISRIKSMGLPVVGYYPVVCEKFSNTTVEPFGVPELMNDFFDRIGPLIGPYREQLQRVKLKIKHDKAVNWVWTYAAGNFAIGTFVPAIADIPALSIVETTMVVHLVGILYDGVDMERKDAIVSSLTACVGPLLASFAGTLAFSEVTKLISYVAAVLSLGVGAGLTIAAQVAGGVVAAGITVAMGRTFITMVEQILEGKIQPGNINSAAFAEQMKKDYKDAKEQIKSDARFAPDKFKSQK